MLLFLLETVNTMLGDRYNYFEVEWSESAVFKSYGMETYDLYVG